MTTPSSKPFKPTFFVNIVSTDPPVASKFFEALDFKFVPWGDEQTVAFQMPAPNDSICLMLHSHERMKGFMRPNTTVVDAKKSTEALFSLSFDSKAEVDATIEKAVKAGGESEPYKLPNYGQDMGMYCRSFADLDGHIWECYYYFGPVGGPSKETGKACGA